MLPDLAVVITDPDWEGSLASEEVLLANALTVLQRIYHRIVVQPDVPPFGEYDLWSILVRGRTLSVDVDGLIAEARCSVSVEGSWHEDRRFDSYFFCAHHYPDKSDGADIQDLVVLPYVPYIPQVSVISPTPRDYVFWNNHSGRDSRALGIAASIIPTLVDAGISKATVVKARVGGVPAPIVDAGFDITIADGWSHAKYDRALAEAFCLVHTCPYSNPQSIPMALRYGVPVFTERRCSDNWHQYLSTHSGIARHRDDPRLYEERRRFFDGWFSEVAIEHLLRMGVSP